MIQDGNSESISQISSVETQKFNALDQKGGNIKGRLGHEDVGMESLTVSWESWGVCMQSLLSVPDDSGWSGTGCLTSPHILGLYLWAVCQNNSSLP